MRVHAPVPTGSGAHVLHAALAARLPGYRLADFSPWWTMVPPALPLFSSGRAGIIHSTADYGAWFKRPGVPLVVTLHNYVCDAFMQPYSSPLQYLHYRTDLRLFSRWTLQQADVVVPVSRFVAERARDDLGIERPMPLIYNGVDEQVFTPSAVARRPGPFRVLFSGNLTPRKRAGLLQPLARALGAGFEICYTTGLGDSAPTVSGPGLRCVGRVAHADMPQLYRSMDALFMPSVREGFGLATAEAMACGLPVVACGESALQELVVDGEGGWLCGVDDLACYAQALRRLADDTAAARRMGEHNRARAERDFTLARMVDDYRRLFEAVLDRDPELLSR